MQTKGKETDRIDHDIKIHVQSELTKNALPTRCAQPSEDVVASILEMTDVVSGNKAPENVAHSCDELNRMLES
ncbi:hypothetical protein FC99_GL001087 [Levilactobacillus koreensis JCM 16448]|uniref:Uncharacterized protein n=1 Tax=Levilactobacillus koreensis TaxID=637971 RepID=A0AAC8UXK9_9LACO|nr:hypothetical protein [Levilactobacillus koreensis]AKP65768.1 hypothetical protein ABN16_12640 [Levilactobacillus koreensis]KRK87261.1 hypothetical protein FC99_GL001087 [Levilactobacillus koreensis JCM 16448]